MYARGPHSVAMMVLGVDAHRCFDTGSQAAAVMRQLCSAMARGELCWDDSQAEGAASQRLPIL